MRKYRKNGCEKDSLAIWRWFAAFLAAAIIGLDAISPAMAAPFAYVGGGEGLGISVIDAATNKLVATIGTKRTIGGVAVSPDGKRAYVTANGQSAGTGSVEVIDTVSNTEIADVPMPTPAVELFDTSNNSFVAAVPVSGLVGAIAINPDGKHAYVTTGNNVLVIDTGRNKVVGTIPVGGSRGAIAVMPDGKHAYVTSGNGIAVIDLAKNKVRGSFTVGGTPSRIAFSPNGKHAYVTNFDPKFLNVSAIDTQANKVAAKIPAPFLTSAVAFRPDGQRVYVCEGSDVLVIDTATNTVVATVAADSTVVFAIGIVPPPPGIPFVAMSTSATIHFGSAPNQDAFQFHSAFTLSGTDSKGINPPAEAVTLQVGTFTATIPPGSFKKQTGSSFTFAGAINGVTMQATIRQTGTLRHSFSAAAQRANLAGSVDPFQVSLIVGDNSGTTSVNATKF